MDSVKTITTILLLGSFSNICRCSDDPSMVFSKECDRLILECPTDNNSRQPTWRRNDSIVVMNGKVNQNHSLSGRIKVLGFQNNTNVYSIEVKDVTKRDNGSFCCITTKKHCSHVIIDAFELQTNICIVQKCDEEMKIKLMLYYILVCFCLVLLFVTSTIVVSKKRRGNTHNI